MSYKNVNTIPTKAPERKAPFKTGNDCFMTGATVQGSGSIYL